MELNYYYLCSLTCKLTAECKWMIDEQITKIYSQVIQANVLHVLSKCCQRVVKSTNNVWETSKVRERPAFFRPDQKNRYLLPSSSGLWVNWTLINRLPDLSEDNLDNTLSLCILISFPLTTRTRLDWTELWYMSTNLEFNTRDSLIKSFNI